MGWMGGDGVCEDGGNESILKTRELDLGRKEPRRAAKHGRDVKPMGGWWVPGGGSTFTCRDVSGEGGRSGQREGLLARMEHKRKQRAWRGE